jgi:hypothetical protein
MPIQPYDVYLIGNRDMIRYITWFMSDKTPKSWLIPKPFTTDYGELYMEPIEEE